MSSLTVRHVQHLQQLYGPVLAAELVARRLPRLAVLVGFLGHLATCLQHREFLNHSVIAGVPRASYWPNLSVVVHFPFTLAT